MPCFPITRSPKSWKLQMYSSKSRHQIQQENGANGNGAIKWLITDRCFHPNSVESHEWFDSFDLWRISVRIKICLPSVVSHRIHIRVLGLFEKAAVSTCYFDRRGLPPETSTQEGNPTYWFPAQGEGLWKHNSVCFHFKTLWHDASWMIHGPPAFGTIARRIVPYKPAKKRGFLFDVRELNGFEC